MKFDNIRLLVNNFEDCYLFYKDILGLTPVFGDSKDNYASFKTSTGYSIGMFKKQLQYQAMGLSSNNINTDRQNTMFIIEVDNLIQLKANLLNKRVAILVDITERPDWGLKTLHISDPEGNIIEFFQPL